MARFTGRQHPSRPTGKVLNGTFASMLTQPFLACTYRVRYEFNRPYWEAKDYQDNDALAVEATAYALHTLFLMKGGGVTILQEQIVAWLNTMRLGEGGFIATMDTIVALQARGGSCPAYTL